MRTVGHALDRIRQRAIAREFHQPLVETLHALGVARRVAIHAGHEAANQGEERADSDHKDQLIRPYRKACSIEQ